jgi:hypothetical protein
MFLELLKKLLKTKNSSDKQTFGNKVWKSEETPLDKIIKADKNVRQK